MIACPIEACPFTHDDAFRMQRHVLDHHSIVDLVAEITRLRTEQTSILTQLAGWAAKVGQLRDMHAPDGDIYPQCQACEAGSYLAEWPCKTAEVLYTPDEITDVLARSEATLKERVEEDARKKEAAQRAAHMTVEDTLSPIRDIPGMAEFLKQQEKYQKRPKGLWTP